MHKHFCFVSFTLLICNILLLNFLFFKKESTILSLPYLPIRQERLLLSPPYVLVLYGKFYLEFLLWKDSPTQLRWFEYKRKLFGSKNQMFMFLLHSSMISLGIFISQFYFSLWCIYFKTLSHYGNTMMIQSNILLSITEVNKLQPWAKSGLTPAFINEVYWNTARFIG